MISYRLSCCAGGSATAPYRPGGWVERSGYRPLLPGWIGVAGRLPSPTARWLGLVQGLTAARCSHPHCLHGISLGSSTSR